MKHVPRIFCGSPLATGTRQQLPADTAHHLLNVLRLKSGAALRLFDGNGGEYLAELVAARKNQAEVLVGTHQAVQRESSLQLLLGQAISRAERMDYTIQKAVELGVSAIQPLETERSLASQREQKKLRHWQEISRSAAEQCGRDRVPPVHVPLSLDAWCDSLAASCQKLLLDPQATQGLRGLDRGIDLCLLSGPEGGLSEGEIERVKSVGFIGVKLGPRILRTETAALAAIAALQTLWGDLA